MFWKEIRERYPHKWLLVEALEAHSEAGRRILEQLAVLDSYDNSDDALESYKQLHVKEPVREMYVFHTDNPELNILERKWMGIRGLR